MSGGRASSRAASRRNGGSRINETALATPRDADAIAAIYNHYVLNTTVSFEAVAHFKEVGFKFGAWLDVGYWQTLL